MKNVKIIKFFTAFVTALLGFSIAAPAQTPGLAALVGLEKGSWTLKASGSSVDGRQVCLGDPKLLLQMQHSGMTCTRYVIENSATSLRVSYKCGNLGHGVTSIRRESAGLLQIRSQGIKNDAPFSFAAEGRRTGSC